MLLFIHLNIHNSSTRSHPSEEYTLASKIQAKIASVNGPANAGQWRTLTTTFSSWEC